MSVDGLSAALLAGGRSTRMGTDKAFIRFGGPPQLLWERQLSLLGALRPNQMMLSHNPDQSFDVPRGVELVVDQNPDCGPLGGLVSCLQRVRNRRLLVLAVDLPYVTDKFLTSLVASPGGVVLQDATFGRYEPVVAIYTHECLPLGQDFLRRGELAMQKFISACVGQGFVRARELQESERSLLRNLNRPEDLALGTD